MIYFEKPGAKNTDALMAEVIKTAQAQNINKIVVASTSGRTAEYLLAKNFDVTVVTHQAGYKEPGKLEISDEEIAKLTADGMQVLATTHFFAGADRSLNRKFQGIYPAELMANTLKLMGQGFKVAVEVAIMAMDAGQINPNEEIIAVGGSGKGADTAVILVPSHSQDFFDTDIKEIICMPRGHKNDR